MGETHLFIIWENALYKKDEIIKDIKENFQILNIYKIEWSKENFSNNLSRFYGTHLPAGCGKEQHCGNGPFLLIIVKDENPKYEARPTSRGEEIVNVTMFDKKTYYRELTGGGHRIHATNSIEETNHDMTLLLGKNVEQFLKQNNPSEEVIELKQDLIGANGWKDASEMFFALNNCVKYAILRNYETLPEEIYVNEHNDIDIICESYEDVQYILNANKVFEEDYRVRYVAKVGDKEAFFDLRHISDDYYCEELEKSIVQNRIYNDKGFYTISEDEYYYTLLYHALLHKKEFAEDYKKRLSEMKSDIKAKTKAEYLKVLQNWLIKNKYIVTIPLDKSVQFNKENAKKLSEEIFKDEDKVANLNLKDNVINWYPFEEGASILRLDSILKEADEKQYDYVILEGILEYAYEMFDGNNPKEQLIEYAKKHLKPSGKLLIITDNKMGIEDISKIPNENKKMSNRKDIEKLLEKTNLKYNKFYYILPNSKATNVVFTDEFLPNHETIERNIIFYDKAETPIKLQNDIYLKVLEQDVNLFKVFANTYFVECSMQEFEDNEIKFVSFSNIRKPKYRIKTIIKGDKVYKTAENEEALQHIENVKKNIDELNDLKIKILENYKNDTIVSEYQKDRQTLDNIIMTKIHDKKKEEAVDLIKKFLKEIKEKLSTRSRRIQCV